jgi:hypothetical protein
MKLESFAFRSRLFFEPDLVASSPAEYVDLESPATFCPLGRDHSARASSSYEQVLRRELRRAAAPRVAR